MNQVFTINVFHRSTKVLKMCCQHKFNSIYWNIYWAAVFVATASTGYVLPPHPQLAAPWATPLLLLKTGVEMEQHKHPKYL